MKKLMTVLWPFRANRFSMQSFVGFTIAVCTLPLLCSCAGMLADSMAKSWVTGKTYEKMSTTLAPPTDGSGRLFIYRTKSSTKMTAQYGVGLMKNATLCTVDDTAYEVVYEVFRYFDLPEGTHEVSCGQDVIKGKYSGRNRAFQKGSNSIQVQVSKDAEIFIRLDATEKEPFFHPVMVDNEQGRQEILKLPYQEKDGHTYYGGKLSEQ